MTDSSGEKPALYTIGHSNHAIEVFIGLLERHGVTALADVRSRPHSRFKQFRKKELERALAEAGIAYVFLGRELGGKRDEPECYVDGVKDYARIARLPIFQEGLKRLTELAREHTVALMCAEREPLDCHRTVLICRELRAGPYRVRHILADGGIEEHEETERRLLSVTGAEEDLFAQQLSREDRIAHAYALRARQLAFG
ncbi:MAG: DUF488 family protein [Candidatus Hydrogenedentota bacterium]